MARICVRIRFHVDTEKAPSKGGAFLMRKPAKSAGFLGIVLRKKSV